jgi:hypothetical protein
MRQWYRPDDVRDLLQLPKTFDIERDLGPQIEKIVRYQLLPMIGQAKADELLAWLEALPQDVESETGIALKTLYDEVFLFLAFSAWAKYHIGGYVSYTNTGPVQKIQDNSVNLSGQQRTEIRVEYEGYAAVHAANIRNLLATNTTSDCRANYYPVTGANIIKA